MAVGDMRYTFTDKQGKEHTVDIPAEVLRKGKRDGLSNRETISLYLANNGYMIDVPKVEKKKTTTRTRKPDEQKQKLIDNIANMFAEFGETVIINPERQVQVDINGEIFEVTLVKKRKPKK